MPEPKLQMAEVVVRITMDTGEAYEATVKQAPNLTANSRDIVHQYLNALVDNAARHIRAKHLSGLAQKAAST